jgi:hypothetical protein
MVQKILRSTYLNRSPCQIGSYNNLNIHLEKISRKYILQMWSYKTLSFWRSMRVIFHLYETLYTTFISSSNSRKNTKDVMFARKNTRLNIKNSIKVQTLGTCKCPLISMSEPFNFANALTLHLLSLSNKILGAACWSNDRCLSCSCQLFRNSHKQASLHTARISAEFFTKTIKIY